MIEMNGEWKSKKTPSPKPTAKKPKTKKVEDVGEEAETSKVEEQFRGSVARSDDITIREVEPKEITQEALDLGMTPLPPHLINLRYKL